MCQGYMKIMKRVMAGPRWLDLGNGLKIGLPLSFFFVFFNLVLFVLIVCSFPTEGSGLATDGVFPLRLPGSLYFRLQTVADTFEGSAQSNSFQSGFQFSNWSNLVQSGPTFQDVSVSSKPWDYNASGVKPFKLSEKAHLGTEKSLNDVECMELLWTSNALIVYLISSSRID